MYDLETSNPTFFHITEARADDMNAMDVIPYDSCRFRGEKSNGTSILTFGSSWQRHCEKWALRNSFWNRAGFEPVFWPLEVGLFVMRNCF